MASPAQMDRDRIGLNFSNRPKRNLPQMSPTRLNEPPRIDAGFKGSMEDFRSFQDEINRKEDTGVNTLMNMNTSPAMGGGNIAQQVLGPAYNRALATGAYTPSSLVDMVIKAQSFGRGINLDGVGGFNERLQRFEDFQSGDGGNFLNVQAPNVTANMPTMGEAFQDAVGGISNLFSGFAEQGPPILQLIKSGLGKVQDTVTDFQTGAGSLSAQINALDAAQRQEFNRLVGQDGLNMIEALRRVSGGVTTLQ